MRTVLTILAFAVISVFFVFDLPSKNNPLKKANHIRIISCLSAAVILLIDVLSSSAFSYDILISALVLADSVLLLSPCANEKPSINLKVAYAGVLLTIGSLLFCVLSHRNIPETQHLILALSAIVLLIAFLPFAWAADSSRFRQVKNLFTDSSRLSDLQMASRFHFLVIILAVLLLFFLPIFQSGVFAVILPVFSFLFFLFLFPVLFIRSKTGHSFIISSQDEKNINEMIQKIQQSEESGENNDACRMDALYKRILAFMQDDKPYLDSSFSMQDMAMKMFSNKLYISRTINQLSGKNFRQFVNSYRIQYALDLFKKDMKLKVNEASEMSGFHTIVSFNMAFKVNKGITPTQWMQEYMLASK